ncbi:MAG: Na+/H+ antiporter subunit E [Xanthomonadaceae bacterium]|nr:Na+/H+ antiporter subunit E [Xanthomonadaceae bacterium]
MTDRTSRPAWLPSPVLSVMVAGVWLMLVNSLAPAHLLSALILGLILPLPMQRLRTTRAGLRHPGKIFRLAVKVLWDIVLSNIEVARRILGPESVLRPDFIWIPLDIQNPYGIATLAGIITMTPGTLSAELSPDNRYLLVHCFNLASAEDQIVQIKQRYEAPLMEIFS